MNLENNALEYCRTDLQVVGSSIEDEEIRSNLIPRQCRRINAN